MTSTPPLDAIRPYTTGDFAMDERTQLELKHVFERIKNGPRGEFAVNYMTDAEQRSANEWRMILLSCCAKRRIGLLKRLRRLK